MAEIKTAEEYVLRELEKEKKRSEELIDRLTEAVAGRVYYKYLLKRICENIKISESEWIGKYLDFDYNISDRDNRNPELFNAVVDFMKENGIIKEPEQTEEKE